MAERVKLADMGRLSGLADTDYVTVEHDGGMRRYPFADFKSAIISESEKAMAYDNVWINYYRKGTSYHVWASLADWPALQDAGEEAIGVTIAYPGKLLVVAPTQSSTTLALASSQKDVGTKAIGRYAASVDMDGQERTAALLAASDDDFVCNTADYAPGFCNLYERVNSDGNGIKAGSWWLPASGELAMIAANIAKVNYALSLIDGAEQIGRSYLRSSTEAGTSAGAAWFLQFSNNTYGYASMTQSTSYRVRAVSAWGL